MSWKLFWRGLRTLYLLRVPLATLVLLAAVGPLARFSPLSSLLENLLDLSTSPWDVFQVSLGAFLLAYAAVTTLNLTLHYGNERFADSGDFAFSQQRPMLTFVAGTASAAMLMIFVVLRTESPAWMNMLLAVGGFAAALVLVFLAKVVQLALTDPV